MKKSFYQKCRYAGFTLLETIVYVLLLSTALMVMIRYVFDVYLSTTWLEQKIERQYTSQSGFGALVAILMLSLGTFGIVIVTLGSAYTFADSVDKRELRLIAHHNTELCVQEIRHLLEYDYFLLGSIEIKEFGCNAEIEKMSGNLSMPLGQNKWMYKIYTINKVERVRVYEIQEVEVVH